MNFLTLRRYFSARNRAVPLIAGAIALTLFTPSAAPNARIVHWMTGIIPPPEGNAAPPHREANNHLTYYGGHVLSNVRVVQVLYGSGNYLGNVSGTVSPTTEQYYTQVVNSIYIDWLREYNTPSSGGTGQQIGRGSFAGKYQIAPDASRNGGTITDSQIETELSAQIDAHVLPAPDANTYYATYFPTGKVITAFGLTSCSNFYGYHSSFSHSGQTIYYGVLPDLNSSGCHAAGGLSQYQTQTEVDSHELIETVTDGDIGRNNLAWYDKPNNGEIGDLCAWQSATLTGADGNSYTVQKEWSNAHNACVAFPAVDFYVDGTAGNDANPGTSALPYKTLRTAYNAAPAMGNFIIHVRPGSYPEPPLPLAMNKVLKIVNWNDTGTIHIGSP